MLLSGRKDLHEKPSELLELTYGVGDLSQWAKTVLAKEPDCLLVRKAQKLLLDFRGKTDQAHELVHARPTDALSAGDVTLALGLAGLKERLPLEGLAEKLDHRGRSGRFGWPRFATRWRDGTNDLAARHPTRQSTDVAVFEGPVRP